MITKTTLRGILLVLAVWVALGLLRYRPWQPLATSAPSTATAAGRQRLTVGFLPVT